MVVVSLFQGIPGQYPRQGDGTPGNAIRRRKPLGGNAGGIQVLGMDAPIPGVATCGALISTLTGRIFNYAPFLPIIFHGYKGKPRWRLYSMVNRKRAQAQLIP